MYSYREKKSGFEVGINRSLKICKIIHSHNNKKL